MQAGQDPTPEDVHDLWSFMTRTYRSKVIAKGSAVEMRLVANALHQFGIEDRDKFLDSYATTIHHWIYVPFQVGTPGQEGRWSLWAQMLTCVHEHEHIDQVRREGIKYMIRYTSDLTARARYEIAAYRTHLEMEWWHLGKTPDPAVLAKALKGYGCHDKDVAVAEAALTQSIPTIRAGGLVSRAAKVALEWLNTHRPHLRAHD